MPVNLIAAAVLAVALIVAAMFGRYEIASLSSQPSMVSRIDRLTGDVETCVLGLPQSSKPHRNAGGGFT